MEDCVPTWDYLFGGLTYLLSGAGCLQVVISKLLGR